MLALIAKHHATRVTTFPPIDRSDNYFLHLHAKFQSASYPWKRSLRWDMKNGISVKAVFKIQKKHMDFKSLLQFCLSSENSIFSSIGNVMFRANESDKHWNAVMRILLQLIFYFHNSNTIHYFKKIFFVKYLFIKAYLWTKFLL